MRKNRFTSSGNRRISEFLWLLTLCFIPMEMAAPLRFGPLSPYKISLILWLVHFAWIIMDKPLPNAFLIRQSFDRFWKLMRPVFIPLFLYLAFDIFSLIWTQDIAFSFRKYASIIPMLVLLAGQALIYFSLEMDLQKAFKRMMAALGLMTIVLCLWTWMVYFRDQRTAYILRLSLQVDYNQYATSILLGSICGMYTLVSLPGDGIGKAAGLFAFNALTLPVLYLSGSRRTMILLLPVVAGYFVMLFLVRPKKGRGRLRPGEQFSRFVPALGLVLAIILSFGVVRIYQIQAEKVYKDMEMDHALQTGKYPFEFKKEMTLAAKQDTLSDGSAMAKRSALWKTALAELKGYSPVDWLIGRGGSHHRDLYRKPDHTSLLYPDGKVPDQPRDLHPHSFILLALLDHGLIGLALSLILVAAALILTFKCLKDKMTLTFTALVLYGGVLLAGQAIDSILGIQENRLTWIFIMILVLAISKEPVAETGEYIEIR